MEKNINKHYIENSISEFRKIKELGDKTFSQIRDEDFFWSPDEDSNSIAIIVRHLSGNMISRWTDFLTTDGEKPTRMRDEEFERIFYTDKDDIISRWESGWRCVFGALSTLKEEDLLKEITIRSEPHTVLQAINRQLTHYSYHTGQIVFIGKHLENANWKSLSIPRGGSEEFNKKMSGKN
ncbi:MAG TPA: DUF1572 family protein [Ignavibacteria bacterium]|nr:DUF1572 family protein [Ignavibacteria bacterium]HMR39403.1 DUF1572 family protein [Ignavibacteria bacterium]